MKENYELQAGVVAQPGECLTSLQEALDSIPIMITKHSAAYYNPSVREVEAGGSQVQGGPCSEFEARLGYVKCCHKQEKT